MELREYFTVFRRWLWFIILVTIVSALTAAVFSFFILEKVYQSSATIIISRSRAELENGRISYNDIMPGSNLIKLYSKLGQSNTVMEQIIADLKLDKTVDDLRAGIMVDTDEETGIIRMNVSDRNAKLANDIVNSLIKNLQVEADKVNLIDNIHILDAPKLPESPIKPKPVLNILIAAIAGGMGGILIALFLHSVDNTVKETRMLQKSLDVPVIGIIPAFGSFKRKMAKRNHATQPNISFDEAYKILRTNVQQISKNNSTKVILVASPDSLEGNTTTAANLAASIGQLEKRVLLVDCNLRKPTLHEFFDLKDKKGLSDYLAKDEEVLFDICCIHDTNLFVIAGNTKPLYPAELLESSKMGEFIERMKQNYDFIILDSPPVMHTADAAILSKVVDGIVLVVRYGHCTYKMASEAVENLKHFNSNILGVVINKVPIHLKNQ